MLIFEIFKLKMISFEIIKNVNFWIFLKTKSDPNIHQNAPNCTKNFSGRHAPEPSSKAHDYAMRSMSLRDMQISKSE